MRDREAHRLPVVQVQRIGYVKIFLRTFFYLARGEDSGGNQRQEIDRFGSALSFKRAQIETLLRNSGADHSPGRDGPNNFGHAASSEEIDENASIKYSRSVGDHSC